jgi:hypothetical protein
MTQRSSIDKARSQNKFDFIFALSRQANPYSEDVLVTACSSRGETPRISVLRKGVCDDLCLPDWSA